MNTLHGSPRVPLLILASMAAALAGCSGSKESSAPSPSGYFDESHFIVQSIVADLSAMAELARDDGKFAPPKVRVREKPESELGHPVYLVRVNTRTQTLKRELAIDRAIWDPELYSDLAVKLLPARRSSGGAAEAPAAPTPSLLKELTAFDVEHIESANREVSARLAKSFPDPAAHEQSALVLGVFGLREASGDFYDVRAVLCRMTAHLAMGRALSGQGARSPEGLVAAVIHRTLMGNQSEALTALDQLDTSDLMRPWKRGLRARITGDYRELDSTKESLTVLERVCLFEALCRNQDRTVAWTRLPARELRARADYSRIVNSNSRSVQIGHLLHEMSLPLEMSETADVLRRVRGWQGTGQPDWSLLDAEPTACVIAGTDGKAEVQVIGWGDWAMFLQRHLGHAVQQQFYFLKRMWGVPEVAAQFAEQADSTFGKLRLYPFVQLANATQDDTFRASADACSQLVRKSPHLVAPALWSHFYRSRQGVASYHPDGLWDVCEWHKHNPPPFTGYLIHPRLNHNSFFHGGDVKSKLEALHELAPYNAEASQALLHVRHGRQGTGTPVDELEQVYLKTLDYSVPQLVVVARLATNNPAFYERHMSRAAALSPSYCFTLGEYLVQRNEPDKAATWYEKGVKECRDAVNVANNSRWLIHYYFHKGRVPEAESLADEAADSYSYAGLQAKGDLLYLQNRYDESLEYYRKIEERYDAPGAIIDWWSSYRGMTNDARFDLEVEKRMKTLFPRGVETVTVASFKGRPDEGVLIVGENDRVREAGLKKGDVIVALNGRRVYDMTQYIYVRCQLKDPEMKLICWDGKGYQERSARPPGYRFGVDFKTYSRR